MTEKEATDKLKLIPNGIAILKNLFSKVTEKFADVKLKDGSVIVVEGDAPAVGAAVQVVSDGGNIPAPDGEYELEDGVILVIASGKITEIKPIEPKEEPMASDDFGVQIKALSDRVTALEEALKTSDAKIVEASKVIEAQKTELKKQFEIQSETFKLVEILANLPATKGVEERSKIEMAKEDRMTILVKNLQELKSQSK